MSSRTGVPTYKEGDEYCGIHEKKGQDGSPSVSENVGDGSSHKNTEEGTALTRLEECTLPFGRDRIFRCRDPDAVSSLECRKCDEVAIQEHVEGLHDLLCIS